jgi:hypothetical protein
MKKVLLTTMILAAMIAPAMADDDLVMKLPTGKICQFKNGKATLHGSCRVPKADALVRRSNRLVKGHPTCAQLLEASKLLQRASELYDKDQSNHDISGEVRNIDRAASWTEDRAKAGKCRKEKASGER